MRRCRRRDGDQHPLAGALRRRPQSCPPHFGNQLHDDARLAIRILEVVDELGQIFDGIDS